MKTKIEQLREQLVNLRKERDVIIFEKGLAAQDNNDLRENSTYDYWLEKEFNITHRIMSITKEIILLAKEQNKSIKK